MYNFNEQIRGELSRIDAILSELPEVNKTLLLGTIIRRNSSNNASYYLETSTMNKGKRARNIIPLGDENSKELHDLVVARIVSKTRKILVENKMVLEKALLHVKPYSISEIIKTMPKTYGEIIKSANEIETLKNVGTNSGYGFHFSEQELTQQQRTWMEEEYDRNPYKMETKHFAIDGTALRSKSEMIIYNILKSYNVPFRYESKLLLRNADGFAVTIYPDFTIKSRSGELLAYEHLGKLSDEQYRNNFASRLALYEGNGYSLWRNLFISEDWYGVLDSKSIDNMIRTFILPQV